MEYKIMNHTTGIDARYTNSHIAAFLFTHLDQFGDKTEDILKCLEYVFDKNKGGNIILGLENDTLLGVVVLNETGMSGYIPENILVYIAVHREHRGRGIGKLLMQQAIALSKGSIALHVEPENSAFHLYKKLGFTNKYLEMRLTR